MFGKINASSLLRILIVTSMATLVYGVADMYVLSPAIEKASLQQTPQQEANVLLFEIHYEILEKRMAGERYLIKPSRNLKEEYYQVLLFTDKIIDSLVTSYETRFIAPEQINQLATMKRSINQARVLERDFVMGGQQKDQLLVRYLFPIYEDIRLEMLNLLSGKKAAKIKALTSERSGFSVGWLNIIAVALVVFLAQIFYHIIANKRSSNA